MTVINPKSISGITSITMPSGADNVLTIHTNNGTERLRVDNSGNVKVGSACTISQDGDVFFTGITTATTFVGNLTGNPTGSGANLTALPAGQLTGTVADARISTLTSSKLSGALPAISALNLTNVPAANVVGVHTSLNVTGATIVGSAVTISESGIEASGIGITCANINGTQIGGRRNKIINGGMLVSERQTSSTDSNVFVVDRFQAQVTQMDNLVQTLEQSTDSPDGFSKSIKITTTTPETSMASNEQFRIQTKLEGQDFQDLEYGSASAKTITISFYVKASVTGTFGFTVYRAESTARVITAPYIISSANTWERKIITIPGDTAGAAITNDTAERFRLMWGLAAGGNFTTASSSWGNYSSANLLGGHNTNTLVTTDNATWQLSGVQLEVGTQATPFEHRSFGDELSLCQRYFQKLDHRRSTGSSGDRIMYYENISFNTPMRAAPSLTTSSEYGSDSGNFVTYTQGDYSTTTNGCQLRHATTSQITVSGTDGSQYHDIRGRVQLSSEL